MNYSLFELNSLVREVIESTLPDYYWVEAELSECRENGGHCYMEMIERDELHNTIIAKAAARCWKSSWYSLKPRFERVTGMPLNAGMKVLFKVRPQLHELYGFSLIVTDIDPTYTLGDMARKRQEIIRILKEEGVFDLNKSLPVPMFAQRIAVVSSATAAGYGDFCNQLSDNAYGFQFTTRLFPAIMQGEQTEQSVISALNAIYDCIEDFDVVVIIRGGGSTADLSGFDTLALAENVANFPLPIITGIGHDRDESILDMISCVRVKTPTAAADFLITNLADTLEHINSLGSAMTECVRRKMDVEQQRISRIQAFIPVAFSLTKTREEAKIERLASRLSAAAIQTLSTERHRIELLQQRISSLDPIHILRRGYSIVMRNGNIVRSPDELTSGDDISVMLAEGVIEATVS